ncbi:MAG: N-6 DNA methylase, partial [Chloroflexota bacterium]|nr:N-6 DNA methylase [Chloroflexota bacterium]
IEVKAPGEDVLAIARSEQVQRYCKRYGQVLVTNLRDFVLVSKSPDGVPVATERFTLATSAAGLWKANAHTVSEELGERFVEYLKRVMVHAAPLTTPRDLAWLLASYARDARMRLERSRASALAGVRSALEDALDMKFRDAKAEHFFRSTLVQTLFYGIFSAWVLWDKDHPPGDKSRFNWHDAPYILRVPIVQALFSHLAGPGTLDALDLIEVLDWAADALNRVDRAAFFSAFEEGHAVQYFYEPFLEAFDPELRKQLGVWYTPHEIVEYMVARVDTVLREELGLADGLADPNVYVLDPCCGTGSYLVEVLRRIGETLQAQGEDALLAYRLKQAATRRVVGFEILPAPFVVAHLQLGLLLQNYGVPLSDDGSERAGVFLTNALTGWKHGPRQPALWPEFDKERDAAERIKLDAPILVVLGNPPYNGFAGIAIDEEADLLAAYREPKRAARPQGQGLNDLYVRFFRMAERRIVEGTGKGIVCYISNYSWLDGLSFTGMRERYLDVFDRIWIDSLNGDKYRTGKLTPWGGPDPSVFSTDANPEGIQVGTAISLLVRKDEHQIAETVEFRNLWGKDKRAQLRETEDQHGDALYETVTPPLGLGLPFEPTRVDAAYFSWPLLPELFPTSFPGVKTSRDDVLVDIDRDRLMRRMEQYFDPSISDEEMREIAPRIMDDVAGFDARSTRRQLVVRGFLPQNIVRYCYRPFDIRWLYWEPETNLLDRKRPEYVGQVFDGNGCLVTQQKPRRAWCATQVITSLGCRDLMDRGATCVPRLIRAATGVLAGLRGASGESRTASPERRNISDRAEAYLDALEGSEGERDLFHHAVAVTHAPLYAVENLGGLGQDWPRIPLPHLTEALTVSAELGLLLAGLLDAEQPVPGVTTGAVRQELRPIGIVARTGGGVLNPDAGDLAITAGWGHAGKGGVVMPGSGRIVERDYSPQERSAIEAGALELGLSPDEALAHLGHTTRDVYLNADAYWRNIPSKVWEYTLGSYQVIKKWLSYREDDLLGRPLRVEEAEYVTEMARRIAAILLLEPRLDANYESVKAATYAWKQQEPQLVEQQGALPGIGN